MGMPYARAVRRLAALAVVCSGLILPGIASAQEPDHFKTLVVRADNTAATKKAIATLSKAGNDATADYKFTIDAPMPADVDDLFTEEGLGEYNAVVLLNTGAAFTLTGPQKTAFEDYFHLGGGLVVVGTGIETEPSWTFLTDAIGARATGAKLAVQPGTVKVFDRVHDATKKLPYYWDRTDAWYNYPNVHGKSHVVAAVVENPFEKQPQGKVLEGIEGGTMVTATNVDLGNDHPVSWCKDYLGGRVFYTSLGQLKESWDGGLRKHMTGAIGWAGGFADPDYSDCGATVLANYEEKRVAVQPNVSEPIGFDQLPDGRVIQTARPGTVRLHDPVAGTTTVLANFGDTTLPDNQEVYTNSEDGMYGPAVDPNFATNNWVYLFWSPMQVEDVKLSNGSIVTQTTPAGAQPNASSASLSVWDAYVGYFQLSRFKFVETPTPHLDLSTEQQILRVPVNRGECCHVAGDIDFDSKGNLWMVTGDDTPAGGIQAGGIGPQNDQKTDEQQTVRVNTGATAGTFTLTFDGQTTDPIAYNATAGAIDGALEALSNIAPNEVQTSGGPVNTANVNVFFRRARSQSDQPLLSSDATGLTTTATPAITHNTTTVGGLYQRPSADARRSSLNTNDLRGKVLRFKVKSGDISPAEENKASFNGSAGAYTIPSGNLFPLVGGEPQEKTRPEVYAMGFRNPFRINLDENDDAYVSDYSPDTNQPIVGRGPAGTGRYEFVRKPANYGWPICMSSKLPSYRWEHHEFTQPGSIPAGTPGAGQVNTTTQGIEDPDLPPFTPWDCDGASVPNISSWNLNGGPSVEPGLVNTPPLTDPDVWYSYQDNTQANRRGTPCIDNYDAQALTDPVAPGSTTPCPRLFPELYTGGVGPHGADKYDYDPDNPSETKFPPYYDGSIIVGEHTQDTMREIKIDKDKDVFKINPFMTCGQFGVFAALRPFECDNPMDMQWGEDGSFYLLGYGDSGFAAGADAGMFRFDYVKGERAPKPILTTDKTNGPAPLTVQFSSAGTTDPDPGDSLTFDWDFGDGTPHSTEANPSHTYTTGGQYTAVLTVSDSSGKSASTSTIITAGNTAPTVVVTTPVAGGTFNFGDNIPFTVTVTDPEDALPINCAEVIVTFALGHDSHAHGEDSDTGCSGTLQTDANDVTHGGNVFGIISASYTDHGGPGGVPALTTTAENAIRQKGQEAELAVNQSGTNTANNTDGSLFTAPPAAGSHRGSLGAGDWIQLNGPFNLTNISDITYRVSDTGTRTAGSPMAAVEVRQDDPVTGTILATHNLVSTGNATTWTSQTFPISMTGTHSVYLVFRAVTGGQTGGNLFNLNWTRFGGGNGVGVPVGP